MTRVMHRWAWTGGAGIGEGFSAARRLGLAGVGQIRHSGGRFESGKGRGKRVLGWGLLGWVTGFVYYFSLSISIYSLFSNLIQTKVEF